MVQKGCVSCVFLTLKARWNNDDNDDDDDNDNDLDCFSYPYEDDNDNDDGLDGFFYLYFYPKSWLLIEGNTVSSDVESLQTCVLLKINKILNELK